MDGGWADSSILLFPSMIEDGKKLLYTIIFNYFLSFLCPCAWLERVCLQNKIMRIRISPRTLLSMGIPTGRGGSPRNYLLRVRISPHVLFLPENNFLIYNGWDDFLWQEVFDSCSSKKQLSLFKEINYEILYYSWWMD